MPAWSGAARIERPVSSLFLDEVVKMVCSMKHDENAVGSWEWRWGHGLGLPEPIGGEC